jgi:hypothetical protein
MEFYQAGRKEGDFEHGVEMVLARILADPRFIYRIEAEPANAKAAEPYRVTDLDLASRLSFFLWSSVPDDELLTVASQGRLKDPAVLEREVRRMLKDGRVDPDQHPRREPAGPAARCAAASTAIGRCDREYDRADDAAEDAAASRAARLHSVP